MAKHTIKGYITYQKREWMREEEIGFQTYEPDPRYSKSVVVREHSIEVEVPDDFNPIPQQVAVLEEQKRLARVELAEKLMHLDDEISKLQCLENTVAA